MGLPGTGRRIRVVRERETEQPAIEPVKQPVEAPEQEPVKVGA